MAEEQAGHDEDVKRLQSESQVGRLPVHDGLVIMQMPRSCSWEPHTRDCLAMAYVKLNQAG